MPGLGTRTIGSLRRGMAVLAAIPLLSACATVPQSSLVDGQTEEIQILAINDLHGYLEDPTSAVTYYEAGQEREELLGGAARLAALLAKLRESESNTITVAAGDLIGASPLTAAYFLDEPTIMALNRMGLSLAAVGNHEFDHGIDELRRIQNGGCEVHTQRVPCQLDDPFEGAKFAYLAANVIDDNGDTLFPGTAMRQFGSVRVGFIGMTLKETGTLTSPGGTRGYSFVDEADTANRLAVELKRNGADAIVLLLHQGGQVDPAFNQDACPRLHGDVLPILDRLTPDIRLVVSGHSHKAYICQLPDGHGGERLLTSAGRYGYFVTDIRMQVNPATDEVISLSAVNDPVTALAGRQADVTALVDRYAEASQDIASRVVGRITGALGSGDMGDTPLARLVADAQLTATRAPAQGGAQVAFINASGVRAGFTRADDGSVTYGQIFTMQPFGNTLEVLEMTGARLKDVLEEQFPGDGSHKLNMIPSEGFSYAYDASAPYGQRIASMTLGGEPIDPRATYRVTVNNFLAQGGDGLAALTQAKFITSGGIDLDALQDFIANGVELSQEPRVTSLGSASEPD